MWLQGIFTCYVVVRCSCHVVSSFVIDFFDSFRTGTFFTYFVWFTYIYACSFSFCLASLFCFHLLLPYTINIAPRASCLPTCLPPIPPNNLLWHHNHLCQHSVFFLPIPCIKKPRPARLFVPLFVFILLFPLNKSRFR